MRSLLALLVVLAVAQGRPHRYSRQRILLDLFRRAADCEEKYKKTAELRKDGAKHTICVHSKSRHYKSGGVTDEDIQIIVDTHNYFRKNPNTTETAGAMCKMYWDENIAEIAQHYAESCPEGHDKNNIVPGYGAKYGGQNIGFSSRSGDDDSGDWKTAISRWFSEVKYFKFGAGSIDPKHKVGDYAQIVKDTACRVGCGYAYCRGKEMPETYVCNYIRGQYNIKEPFERGKPCEKCSEHCEDDALCDTGGKMCYNGVMDYETNTCKCKKHFTGASCEILQCSGADRPLCNDKDKCKRYSNYPGRCPVLCELCTKEKEAGNNWIPAPAVKLQSGSSGNPGSFPEGKVKAISQRAEKARKKVPQEGRKKVPRKERKKVPQKERKKSPQKGRKKGPQKGIKKGRKTAAGRNSKSTAMTKVKAQTKSTAKKKVNVESADKEKVKAGSEKAAKSHTSKTAVGSNSKSTAKKKVKPEYVDKEKVKAGSEKAAKSHTSKTAVGRNTGSTAKEKPNTESTDKKTVKTESADKKTVKAESADKGKVKAESEKAATSHTSTFAVDCSKKDHLNCATEWFKADEWCKEGQKKKLNVGGVHYTAHSLCPHKCSEYSGCKRKSRKACRDHPLCKNPVINRATFCKKRANVKYIRFHGERFTPLELCPESCKQC